MIKLLEMLLPMFGDVMNLLNYAAKLLEAGNEGQRQVSAQLQELIDQVRLHHTLLLVRHAELHCEPGCLLCSSVLT